MEPINVDNLTRDLIQIGCDDAEVGVGWFTREGIETARQKMNSNIPLVRKTLAKWAAAHGLKISDMNGLPVEF